MHGVVGARIKVKKKKYNIDFFFFEKRVRGGNRKDAHVQTAVPRPRKDLRLNHQISVWMLKRLVELDHLHEGRSEAVKQ